ncbi:DNA polymerase IV [Marivirga tractuosa]|uniref:DNA polymerase IV n=1 Tax=Marivirga tractuosa (strain ATCC 23168 / DSM 4126 / NBRC 15989 / NCIMB 1408 / VKM B-1430 / H-43) TaxID=643867 RepID=E4TP95_MARTH|nr:DNA polymerase IV [Marivirga tractuosa]ADR20498.1 DNA-directed DNA polymerase [Marivirga tractuosa DSM 4126]BDD15056.1 DNA polymerase IV [Marivirga tractuosa]
MEKERERKIIHVDMDAFYASVEQMDFPDLKDKPVAVGGNRQRGVVAAASYEARKYGIHSAMPSKLAASKCKDLVFVKPRFDRYRELSHLIREIFYRYTDLVEPLSLDEAYLDVTENKMGISTATDIAIEIKKAIKSEIGLTASAGVSINKFLAKIASDYRKPDGIFIIKPHQVLSFIEQLPIEKFFGVGKKTAEKMHRLNIKTGADLQAKSLKELVKHFGKQGRYFYSVSRGEDYRKVNPNRIRKSVGAENTFSISLKTKSAILEALQPIAEKCWKRYKQSDANAHTITLKVKFDDFKQITRSKSFEEAIYSAAIFDQGLESLMDSFELYQSVRLVGCSLSNFEIEEKIAENGQLTLRF